MWEQNVTDAQQMWDASLVRFSSRFDSLPDHPRLPVGGSEQATAEQGCSPLLGPAQALGVQL
jgi:hypothetical protein